MSKRLLSALVLGLAVVSGPMSGVAWSAPLTQAETDAAAAITASITAAVQKMAADTPGWAALPKADKDAKIQAAVLQVLNGARGTPAVKAAALAGAVKSGAISAGAAIAVANLVGGEFAQLVVADASIQQALKDQGLTTASVTTNGATVSVLTSLANGTAPAGTPVVPAAFDPCAGVTAVYCG